MLRSQLKSSAISAAKPPAAPGERIRAKNGSTWCRRAPPPGRTGRATFTPTKLVLPILPILRHRQGRTLINFNSKLVHAGHDAAADALAAAFSGFLRNNIDRGDMIEVTLAAGGAMIWWDELFLHGRRPVAAGAEKRTYRKAGIGIRPS